jgi:hypothetical protein
MQKVINVIALLSGLTSLAVIGSGVYVYINIDKWKAEAKENLANAAVEAISGALPGLIDAAMPEIPELPTSTGNAILVKREASRQFFLYVLFHSVWTSIVSVFDSD